MRIGETDLKEVHRYSATDEWERIVLKSSTNRLVPLLHRPPSGKTGEYVIITHPEGKNAVSNELIEEWLEKGVGIILPDLSGMGENALSDNTAHHTIARFHTLSRSNLWLGRTLMGEWVRELNLITGFMQSVLAADQMEVDGTGETGLAALFSSALSHNNFSHITLREAPVSYMFDDREHINFFSMAIHLPGILKWGDVSLAAALTNTDITFINPVTMSGKTLEEDHWQAAHSEFEALRSNLQSSGKTVFVTK